MPERATVWVRAERPQLVSAEAGRLVSASRPRIAAGDRRSIPPAPLYSTRTYDGSITREGYGEVLLASHPILHGIVVDPARLRRSDCFVGSFASRP